MKLRIRQILLWPKNPTKSIRRLTLELDKINVITGMSQTGKSALISIIDYCLGAGKCTIPIGIIREKTAWFGLLLEVDGTQLLLARREPGKQAQTGDMLMLEGVQISVPESVDSNCSVDAVKERLNQLAGLSSLSIDLDGDGTFGGRPSFRDLAAFNFLPQHIVANPYTMFFKADTMEHQEKLRNIFPLVLGALDKRTLALRHELKNLQRMYDRKSKELEAKRRASDAWVTELRSFYLLAMELGLLGTAPPPPGNWPPFTYIGVLRGVAKDFSDGSLPTVPNGATEAGVRQVELLAEREIEVARALGTARHKLIQLENLEASADDYSRAIETQQGRLSSVGWFATRLQRYEHECPFCGSEQQLASDQLAALEGAAIALQRSAEAASRAGAALDRQILTTRQMVRDLEDRLSQIRQERQYLNTQSQAANEQRQTQQSIYRFLGRLDQALHNYQVVQSDGELETSVAALSTQIEEILGVLRRQNVEEKQRAAIEIISKLTRIYTPRIGVERPDAEVRLDVQNLTVEISSDAGRRDFLWEIGSGANWMGYHICLFLALHEFFSTVAGNPVPTFLVIDQPSQVYFPERWPEDLNLDSDTTRDVTPLREQDIDGVRRIFETLALGLVRSRAQLQILVIDHAGEITWQGVEGIHPVANWRGEALIPDDW